MSKVDNAIKNLKSALLSLPATGDKGFEGLLGVTLHEITGFPFRLAGSGSQFGVDGKPTYEQDSICFEAKLYRNRNSIPRNEIISKISDIAIKGSETNIWILGATCMISSQIADDVRKLGSIHGIAVLILDWAETDISLPPLAVALAMAGGNVQEFLKHNLSDDCAPQESLEALEIIKSSEYFDINADRIRANCSEPSIGEALAQKANTDWLKDGFSNRIRAKKKFGQPLSPGDTDTSKVWQRKSLIDKLTPYFTSISGNKFVFILGDEGQGKSWLVAQSWLALENKPLMVFLSPEEFYETTRSNNAADLLISNLIKQTGDRISSTTQERWRRRLKQWHDHPATDKPRIVVFIDGINQRPKFDWARIIEAFVDELDQLGGRLIITARTQYFQDRVMGRLSLQFTNIIVSEWTESERDELMIEQGIDASSLHPPVAASLRNPRILGIAFELLDKAEISDLEELNVSRLLFEHMRVSERDAPVPQPVHEFARKLQKHAQKIIHRLTEKQLDDLKVFEEDMGAVADGRFFQTIDGDPTRYCLKDEGLTLALGFAIIDRLLIAKRNTRDLHAILDEILEPVAALDDTANVIMAALTIAAVSDSYGQDITSALAKGFSVLQNPDQSNYPVLVNLVKSQPQGFLDAAYSLGLAGGHQPNFDWLQGALIEASADNHTWQAMSDKVHHSLSAYSLSPERGAFKHHTQDSEDKVNEEREKNRKRIDEKLSSLSVYEQTILHSLHEEEGDLSSLSRLAIFLLAGKPLAPFVKSFINWSFSIALNSDHTVPYKDFKHLVSLNRNDWFQTREALLEAGNRLREADVSRTGKWALVSILRATGHSDDDSEAQALEEELTKDKSNNINWRLIESYCATDPCDPLSVEPQNVTETAEKYVAIDVEKIRQSMWPSADDHFFEMARPGITRFMPEIAIKKHREFALNVLNRSDSPLKFGLFELIKHSMLLTNEEAHEFIKKRQGTKTGMTSFGLPKKEEWIVSQHHLLLAFPFLSAREQADILLSDESDESILLSVLELAKPLSKKEFECLLEIACVENNERKQYLILLLAVYTSVQISSKACGYVAELFRSESRRVQALAMSIISQSSDNYLLRQIVESDWKAADTETDNVFEPWVGSVALLEAAARNLIEHSEVIDRISIELYGRAATMLNEQAVCNIALRIDASIKRIINLDCDLIAPDIELEVDQFSHYEPYRFSVSERPSKTNDISEVMKRLTESEEDFEKRQNINIDAFQDFKATLTQANACIILNYLSLNEFARVVATAEDLADNWFELFMHIKESKLPAVHNLVVLLANSLGTKHPDKAIKLFQRVKGKEPLVRYTFRKTGVHLEMMAVWASACNTVLEKSCFDRLDRACTNYIISLEVLAALMNGRQELLFKYIKQKLSSNVPAEVARGIMVAGLSDNSTFNDDVLKEYEGKTGLIGSTHKLAIYAYERNLWAKHWFEKMCETNDHTDFWRYAVLFSKIVDGRFIVWKSSYKKSGRSVLTFGYSIEHNLERRFSRWKDHRNKKLFGLDAPNSIFVTGKYNNE